VAASASRLVLSSQRLWSQQHSVVDFSQPFNAEAKQFTPFNETADTHYYFVNELRGSFHK